MAIKSAYSASLSCSSFIPFENSKMGLMNSNCRPAMNRREQGEPVTTVSSLSQSKLPEIHCSTPESREDRQGKPFTLCFKCDWNLPFTSHHCWWAPTTVAEELVSKCKIMLFLGFLRALNAPQHCQIRSLCAMCHTIVLKTLGLFPKIASKSLISYSTTASEKHEQDGGNPSGYLLFAFLIKGYQEEQREKFYIKATSSING